MSMKNDKNVDSKSAKVIQLGFNISVTGDSDADFEIVLDDNENRRNVQAIQSQSGVQLQEVTDMPKKEVARKKKSNNEIKSVKSFETANEELLANTELKSCPTSCSSSSNNPDSSGSKELTLINDIKNTMEHFEKFSDHIKEIPRFKINPIASSTPFPDKENSKSESNLHYPERKPRRYAHLYDFNSRREYLRGKPFPSDLFLRPLPGADLYKRGMVKRFDFDPPLVYGSVDSLTKSSDNIGSCNWKSSLNEDKYRLDVLPSEVPSSILKKTENDIGEKSTSSAESGKDIKIYQNGGILIMQNFKENNDLNEKRGISDFSAKLIENCNKLKEEINTSVNSFSCLKDKALIGTSSEETQSSGKMVQFDLLGSDYQKNGFSLNASFASKEDSFGKEDPGEFIGRGFLQDNPISQDFLSMSTQENDSIVSNAPGMSPGASGKKLEWDSGADVGYLNLDLSKENLSTIERIVLRGLSSDGLCEKNVVYEKKGEEPLFNSSKVILERKPSEVIIEEIIEVRNTLGLERSKRNYLIEPAALEPVGKSCKLNVKRMDKSHKEFKRKQGAKESKEVPFGKQESSIESVQISSHEVPSKDSSTEDVLPERRCNVELVNNAHNKEIPPPITKIKTSKTSPKVKKARKKFGSQKTNPFSSGTSKEKLGVIGKKSSSSDVLSLKMGVPKKVYKKVEAKPKLNDVERIKEIGESVVEQSLKLIKHTDANESSNNVLIEGIVSTDCQEKEAMKPDNGKRPISASSTKTVLTTSKLNESKDKKKSVLVDQIIQTNDFRVESVGVQAFSSQKSSSYNNSSSRHTSDHGASAAKNITNTSSKNIQAFGLNSSLPKELAYSKETKPQDAQNTKSTQYFGGPINSLPNYHSNLVTKAVESCGRMAKVLKPKKKIASELIHLQEKNKKNILVDCSSSKSVEPVKSEMATAENKENVLDIQSVHTIPNNENHFFEKKSTISTDIDKLDVSEKKSIGSGLKEHKKSTKESQNSLRSSENFSCCMLTSEHLKEHGDSIDRNLIQEKYFQSQLAEIESKTMISKSTSMDFLFNCPLVKDSVTVGCQYSSRSVEECSDDKPERQRQKNRGKSTTDKADIKEVFEQYDSSQNVEEGQGETSKNTNQGFGTGDSFPSSTQTANSWVPGMQGSNQNESNNVVGRARSFEYLPGHIYESTGNLREKLPSEAEHNVITGTSSSDLTGRASTKPSERAETDAGSSEGRKTVVLENSNENSWDSGQMKNLEENLTQLNIVVTRLREKDTQIQKITRSVLVNLWRHNGSGDSPDHLGTDTPVTKINEKSDDKPVIDSTKERQVETILSEEVFLASSNDSLATRDRKNRKEKRKNEKERDVSIACQTEGKSTNSSMEKYYEERKVLENRLAADKESQIKWIEKEIYHLNILRGMLEKQNSISGRKQKSSNLTLTNNSQGSEIASNKMPKEVLPQAVTPVYGCTISLLENNSIEQSQSPSGEGSTLEKGDDDDGRVLSPLDAGNYGMAVSLNGNLRKVMLLPVGVQVAMNKMDFTRNCVNNDDRELGSAKRNSPCLTSGSQAPEHKSIKCCKSSQSDVMTQYPSGKKTQYRGNASTSVQADLLSPKECNHCEQKNCVCLSISPSDKSEVTMSSERYTKSDRLSERRDGSKLCLDSHVPAHYSINHKTVSNTTGTDTINTESSYKAGLKCCGKGNNHSMNSTNISTKGKIWGCRCENCPRRNPSNVSRSCNSRGPCQSNVYPSHEKVHGDPSAGSCRCSKVQIDKSNCGTCHVIKIVGPACCSSENSCKKRNLVRVENQSCQTENTTVENKNLVTNPELVVPNKGPSVICPVERRVAVERRHSVDEKFLCAPKVSYDKRQSQQSKMMVREKCAVQKETPETGVPMEIKTPIPSCACECSKKENGKNIDEGQSKSKKLTKDDDHPRHYFLKIEETEVDEVNESMERRRSLEVITVTVPVKKAGKAKIYGNDVKQAKSTMQKQTNGLQNESTTTCNCCRESSQPNTQKFGQSYQSHMSSDCQKLQAEKPDTYRRINNDYAGVLECDYAEDIDPCNEEYGTRDQYPSRSSQDGYRASSAEYTKSGSYQTRPDNSTSDCYSRNKGKTYSRETPSDFDSHKEYRLQIPCHCSNGEGEQNARQAVGGRYPAEEPFEETTGSKTFRPRKNFSNADQYDSDYYNYNKREFMTKSELIKEEQKKKKVHQPSLQEYLASNRPDFYTNAENRRKIISDRAKERAKSHNNRMECLMNLMHQCNNNQQTNGEPKKSEGSKRMFTTPQMREQTMKRYRQLPEVTEKVADLKKKEEYRTNKLMADMFAKKLQIEALKGHLNLSNSVSVLSTI